MNAFAPRPSLRNGHWMTLYSWGNPRSFPTLPAPARRYFDVAPDARVAADCHWQPRPWAHPTLIALHGLNGSADAHYMRGVAAKAFARGMNVVRLNQRNCGNTEHLAAGLFHSGLTTDAARVIAELTDVDGLRVIGVCGYSLGGNLALKLAGEWHEQPNLIPFLPILPLLLFLPTRPRIPRCDPRPSSRRRGPTAHRQSRNARRAYTSADRYSDCR